jgi:hypothetical protein
MISKFFRKALTGFLSVGILVMCQPFLAFAETIPGCEPELNQRVSQLPSIQHLAGLLFTSETSGEKGERSEFLLTQMIAKAATKFIADNKIFSQMEKAAFWLEIVRLLNQRMKSGFTSDIFTGSDGSIVFQGAHMGTILVIDKDGVVFRGNLKPALDKEIKPRPQWQADYSALRRVWPTN